MIKEDYIMRQIKEMIRAVLKLIFNIDSESPAIETIKDVESQKFITDLYRLIDSGEINEAEDWLFDNIDENNRQDLVVALLFYSYLNNKDNDFLESNDFSRDEINLGLRSVVSKYGLSSMADTFFEEK